MAETKALDRAAWLAEASRCVQAWEAAHGDFDRHPSVRVPDAVLREAFEALIQRLRGNYPFFHPRYAGQMLKAPHPAAVLGYAATMLINPNNHALDSGAPTAVMEKEVVKHLARMFGLPKETLGHLTSSGTIANLEALWVGRCCQPDKALAFSEQAHYTHGRMADVLGMRSIVIPADQRGRMELEALDSALKTGSVGTVVLTTGTTSLGAVDPVAEAVPLCRAYGARVHVDAAYGGFYALLSDDDRPGLLSQETARHFRAIEEADSVVIDPHKHGLQPYGCGCLLLRDPTLGRYYQHDSPYTYFSSDALHLGEISLECSRAGAAAAALWLTLKVLPLATDRGLGLILTACLHAAQRWTEALQAAEVLRAYVSPELDIVTFFPERRAASAIDAASQALFTRAVADADPIYLSVLSVRSGALSASHPAIRRDQETLRILRSALMKPEHASCASTLVERLDAMAQQA